MYDVAIAEAYSYDKIEVQKSLNIIFKSLDMDLDNPFKELIKPGQKVFIKPNWVASRWRESCEHKDDIYSVITHPAIIETICDKVAIAMEGKGEIIIGDNPSIDADFKELMLLTNIKNLENIYQGFVKIMDLRPLFCDDLKNYGIKSKMLEQEGDINGETTINLGKDSLFYGNDPCLFRGVFNEREETIKSHSKENHLYTYANSIYNSDLYISIPKLKTHHKTGITLNLKGLVGTITQKNQLIHWKVGYPQKGGDEYPSKEIYEEMQITKIQERGAWAGNDTIWRMVVDLYSGFIKKERKYFTVIDGILGGEGQGPFCPNSVKSNTLIASRDLLACDIVACRYMGIDPSKIKYLKYLTDSNSIDYKKINVYNNLKKYNNFFNQKDKYLDFKVKELWKDIKI